MLPSNLSVRALLMVLQPVLVALALAAALPGSANAELFATPLPGDTRLVQFDFDPDNTYLILTKPKAVTDLEFSADESILTVAAGDNKQWEFTPTQNRKHIFVKPYFERLETTLTVLTDKRSYQFVVRSTGDGLKWYQRVNWRQPQSILMDLREQELAASKPAEAVKVSEPVALTSGLDPQSLKFEYQIVGDAPFKPTNVFNNGKFTYIQLPPNLQEVPALFSVTETGEAALVNYTPKGDYLVAQMVLTNALLKLGKQEVRIERRKAAWWQANK